MLVLICFDISDDRVRYRVVKVLLGYGARVQKSVFQCRLRNREALSHLQDEVEALIDHRCDSVHYYPLCRECAERMEWSGTSPADAPGRVTVI